MVNCPETFWEIATKTRMGTYLTKVEVEFFSKSLDFYKCKTVCDLGAGAGKFSLLAAEKDSETVAIDIGKHGLQRLKRKNPNINLILADAQAVPIKRNSLDAVFSIEMLDYISDAKTVFSECSNILKNDGTLVFSFGNKSSLKSKLRELRGKKYLHSYREAMSALTEKGFEPTKKQGYNWLPFNRTSENLLIPLFVKIEKLLGLRRIPRFSPWVLIKALKKEYD